ncbi:MAG: twitching motility protein PilT, partial [Rhodothermales bacterium]
MTNPALADILAQQVKSGAASMSKARVRAPIVPPLPAIVKTITDSIPESMYSEDRVRYMADQVNSLLEKDRVSLREHVQIFIKR